MENYRCALLIILLQLFYFQCFGNENIDTMCGIWSKENPYKKTYETLAIERISDSKYFVLYTDTNDHVLDLSQIGTVLSDNLIHIHKEEGEDFYVYLDYEENSVYFLWNHIEPSDEYYDTELKRVTELYDEELNKKKMTEFNENFKQSILKSLKK